MLCYAQQVISEATGWMERPSDSVRSFKEVCTLVSAATSALVDNQELYSGTLTTPVITLIKYGWLEKTSKT